MAKMAKKIKIRIGRRMTKLLSKSRLYKLNHISREVVIVDQESWEHPWGSPKGTKMEKWRKC